MDSNLNINLSLDLPPFEELENFESESANKYIDLVANTLQQKLDLETSSTHFKILRYASLTILTGALILPVGLPVMAVTALFASILVIGSAAKTVQNSKNVQRLQSEFCKELTLFEKEIFQKLVIELPEIFRGKYKIVQEEEDDNSFIFPSDIFSFPEDTEDKPMMIDVMRVDGLENFNQIRDALVNWKNAFRSIHCYSLVQENLPLILNTIPKKPDPRQENLPALEVLLFDMSEPIDFVLRQVNLFIKAAPSEDYEISNLIEGINCVNASYREIQKIYPELMRSMKMDSPTFLQTHVSSEESSA